MKINRWFMVLTLIGAMITTAGCRRGQPSQKPGVHIIQDMYKQPKNPPMTASDFFADGSVMRPPVEGTVARGWLKDDSIYYTGIDPMTGEDVVRAPLPINMENLKRGQDRFDVFCAVCHGYVGDGLGIMVSKGYVQPPSFHIDRLRELPDGHFYRIIREGSAIMPSYAQQIPVQDRWSIVLYIRALQLSQNAGAIVQDHAIQP
jgi:mono/diheme cytochrome c family protein